MLRPDEANEKQRCWIEIGGEVVQFVKDPFALQTRIKQITDGTSKTIMIAESAYYKDQDDWPLWIGAAGRDEATLFKTSDVINCNVRNPSFPLGDSDRDRVISDDCAFSWHAGGGLFVFVDGSVHFLSESLDLTTYRLLADREDGYVLDEL